MSDGGFDATRGHRRTPRPTLGAAPWERFAQPACDDSAHRWLPEPAPDEAVELVDAPAVETEKAGCHTDGGLTVADLIAKVGAPSTARPSHHRVAPDAEIPDIGSELPVDLQDTQVIDTPAYLLEPPSQLPDLAPPDYADYDEFEPDEIEGSRAPEPRSEHREPKTKRRRRPILVAARSMAAFSAVLALVLTGGAWQWSASKNNRLNIINALDQNSSDIRDPGGQYGDEDFLIVGMDSRSGENANMGAGDTEDAGGTRSDTVMLVNIPANRKRVVAVSFPRDLAITPIQ